MNEQQSLHPSSDRLREFLRGQLRGAEAGVVEAHVVDCEACCNRLADLNSDDDPLLANLKSDVFDGATPPPVPDWSSAPSPLESTSLKSIPEKTEGNRQHGESRPHELNGKQIGPYRLLGLLGEGGMGRVYRARHERLNRVVALKTIHDDRLRDPMLALRFSAEAEIVAQLNHPNIVQVYDVGRHNEQPYYAMELVEGESLEQAIRKGAFNARDAAEIVRTLAEAIHAAHQMGVVHRDLKPANVLLDASDPNRGVAPKIADFGIAKQLDSDSDLTQTGMVAGTPNYMAPEQVRGQTSQIGPHTDIFALGVILYELMTGRTPFSAATPLEVMNQILDREPPSPTQVGTTAPPDLVSICLQCLHKQPARRYATAQALADDLARFLAGETVAARRVGLLERSWRWSRRRPSLTALLTVVTLLALVGFPGVTWLWLDASRAKQLAEQSDAAGRWASYRANIAAAGSFLQLNNTSAARRSLDAAPEEHRNWEWNHYNQRLKGAKLVMRGHAGVVRALAISPDGSRVASASADRTVRIWNSQTGALIATLPGQQGVARNGQLEFSPDGRLLLADGANDSVNLWNALSWDLQSSLPREGTFISICRFSHDGARIVTQPKNRRVCRIWKTETAELVEQVELESNGSGAVFSPAAQQVAIHQVNGSIGIWDATEGDRISEWRAHDSRVVLATYSPDGKLLATAGDYSDNEIKLWSVPSGDLVSVLSGHQNAIYQCDFSPDGLLLASCTANGEIALWDVAKGASLAMRRGHSGPVYQVAFTPDGTMLASASRDQTVRFWDPTDGSPIALMHGHADAIQGLAFDPQGKTLYSASDDQTIAVWDVQSRRKTGVLRGHAGDIGDVAFSPDGARCASAAWDGTVRVWDVTNEKQLLQLFTDAPIATGVAFHPSGDQLAAVDRKSLTVWDAYTGEQLLRERLPDGHWPDRRVAVSPDGRLLVTSTFQGEVWWWNAHQWKLLAKTKAHDNVCRDLAFSPDSQLLVTASHDGSARVWNTHTRERVATLEGHQRQVTSVSFDRNGAFIVTGSEDGTARIWDAHDFTQVAELNHGTYVYDVAFSPNGQRLAVGCDNHSIRFWDVATWTDVGQLLGHEAFVWAIAFSPDGGRLLSGSGDDTLRIWDAPSPNQRSRRAISQPAVE